MSDLKFVVDVSDIHTLKRELLGVQKSAKDSANVFNREWNKAETALRKTATANQVFYNETLKVGTAFKSAATSASVFEKALATEEKRLEGLKLKYNQTYKSAQQFKNTLRELNTAHKAGVISAANHSDQIERLKNDYRSFLNGTAGWSNQFTQGATRAGKSLNKFGMYSQQFGYQMSDFVVQVQGGTSAFVAFGQQGAQLFGLISGPWGAALSIGAALIGGFGAAWMKTKANMAEAETGAKSLQDRIKSLNSSFKDFRLENQAGLFGNTVNEQTYLNAIKEVEKQIDKLAPIVKQFKEDADFSTLGFNAIFGTGPEEELAELRRKLNELWVGLGQEQEKAEQERVNKQLEANLDAVGTYLDAYVSAQKEAGDIAAAITKENSEREIEAAEKLQEIRFASAQAVHDSLVEETKEMERQHLAAKAVADQIMEAYNRGEDLSKLDLAKPIQGWADVALILAQRMGDAAAAGRAIMEAQAFGMSGGTGLTSEDVSDWNLPKSNIRNWYKDSSKSGGSRGETQEEFLAKLEREIELKRDSIGIFGEERSIMEQVAKLKEQVIKKDYNISEAKLEQLVREEHALEEKLKREEDLYNTINSSISDSLMDLVKGATSVEDAFKNMLSNILEQIYQSQVAEPLADIGSDLLSGLFKGFTSSAAPVTASMPTRTVSNNAPVATTNQQSTNVVVSLSPELVGQVLQQAEENSVRVVSKAVPGIVQASTTEVMKKRRQGGAMKAAFG